MLVLAASTSVPHGETSGETSGHAIQPAEGSRCTALRYRLASGEKDACVIFYHVPKTSGADYPPPAGWNQWSHYGALPDPPPPELYQQNLFLRGHWTPRFKDEYVRRNCWQVTMLRQATLHALSAFYFHGHESYEWPSCLGGECDRSTSAGAQGCCPEQYANGQTRQLSARGGVDVYAGALGHEFPLPGDALQAAQTNLRSMDIVGISEDRTQLVRMMAALLNTSSGLDASTGAAEGHATISAKRRLELSQQTLASIVEANTDDWQLYNLAKQLAAEDASCLLGAAALPPTAVRLDAGVERWLKNGTAMATLTVVDDEAGIPAFPGTPAASRASTSSP